MQVLRREMTNFRILYLTEKKGEEFRSKAPSKPPYSLKRSHYEDGPEVAAESPYALWQSLRDTTDAHGNGPSRPFGIGDALETGKRLFLCNYWGFDSAEWRDAAAPPQASQDEIAATGSAPAETSHVNG